MELSSRFADLLNGNGHGDVSSCSVADLPAGVEREETPQARSTLSAGLEEKERRTPVKLAEGNKGGPGNPYNRRVALLKTWLLEEVTQERIKRIGIKLMDMAEEGCVPAARVLFQYVLPKSVEPDRLDMEEWEILKQAGGLFGELPGMMNKPEAELPLKMVRAARPMMTESIQGMTANLLATPQEKVGEVLDLLKNDPKGAREYLTRRPTGADPAGSDSRPRAGGKKRRKKKVQRGNR